MRFKDESVGKSPDSLTKCSGGLLTAVLLTGCVLVQGCTGESDQLQRPQEEPAPTETTSLAPPEPPPNPIVTYAQSIELPEGFVLLLAPWGEDGDMSESDQQTVDVTQTIAELNISDEAKTRTITYVASGKAQEYLNACDQLKSVSETVLADYLMTGIDEGTVDYLAFLNALGDREFANLALMNRLCIYDGTLDDLEKLFLADPDKAEYAVGLVNRSVKQMEAVEPEFTSEMVNNVPEFKTIDANLVCVAEKLAWVVKNAKDVDVFGTTFESMLQEGIPGKRLMFTPGQCIAWVFACEDGTTPMCVEREQPQKQYYEPPPGSLSPNVDFRDPNLARFIKYAWEETSSSDNYASALWDFEKTTERINSPSLVLLWKNRIHAVAEPPYTDIWQNARTTFDTRHGDCEDTATLFGYFLSHNGYEVCIFAAGPQYNGSHVVLGWEQDSSLYYNDAVRVEGPFGTVAEAAEDMCAKRKMPFHWYRVFSLDSDSGILCCKPT